MNILKIHKSILFILLLPYFGIAQTVNTGELYVTTGTQFSTVGNFNNTPTGTFINDGDVYVYANWNNNGMVDFLGNTGLTRYVGNNIQAITGNETSYFYNVLFNNFSAQPAFQLNGAISVSNESSFDMGIVDTDNFGGNFIFEQNATHDLTSNTSHVDGFVQKRGDSQFTYPIGDGEFYRFAEISAPNNITDTFTGKYFLEDTNTNYPVENMGPDLILINSAEHWTIERSTGDSDVLITLSWSTETTPVEILTEPYDAIHIARWDEALKLWVDEGGVVDVDAKTVTTAVDNYGVFTLAKVKENAVLPCALTVYNLLTPNGDGMNDFFEVKQAINDTSCAQNLKVTIFNRWGVKVYEEENYDTTSTPFGGYSNRRGTLNRDERLPTGTYFYILTFDYQGTDNTTMQHKKAGYLYINGNQ